MRQPLHTDLVGEVIEHPSLEPNAVGERIGFVRAVFLKDNEGEAEVVCLVADLRGKLREMQAIDLTKYMRRA